MGEGLEGSADVVEVGDGRRVGGWGVEDCGE